MRVLITLGPTQEPIDPVRFITNASSGKMGDALAREALDRGHEVTIVAGPVSIDLPEKARTIRVRTARQMVDASMNELSGGYDLMICTAAIADYRPKKVEEKKIRSGLTELDITLEQNPKLTRESRNRFPELYIVAFKAEHGVSREGLLEAAGRKMKAEDLDMIVANDISANGFGSDLNAVLVLDSAGCMTEIERDQKRNIARRLWDLVEAGGARRNK